MDERTGEGISTLRFIYGTYQDGHGQLSFRLTDLSGLFVIFGLLQAGCGSDMPPQSHYKSNAQTQSNEQGNVREQELGRVGDNVKFFEVGAKPVRVAYSVAASSGCCHLVLERQVDVEGENEGEQGQDSQLWKADDFEVSSLEWEGDHEEPVDKIRFPSLCLSVSVFVCLCFCSLF